MPDLFGVDRYEGIRKSAEISDCGRYRWWLRRSFKHGGDGRVVCFVMLNPSTADGLKDDQTIRKCIGFVKRIGASVLDVRNLFAFRATDPAELLTADNPTGGERGDIELRTAITADLVIVAWGGKVPFGRQRDALRILAGKPLYCLGVTKDGSPRHPLYVRGDAQLVPYGAT